MADRRDSRIALRFIILIGILSFFADFTYEGSRSIVGPYLATLHFWVRPANGVSARACADRELARCGRAHHSRTRW